jgi:AraC-like DNA-binding protein
VYTKNVLTTRDPLRFEQPGIATADAAHAWRDWVHAWLPGLRVQQLAKAPGSAHGIKLADARLWRIQTPAQQRVQAPAVSDPSRNGFVALKLEGESFVSPKGRREVAFRPGQLWIGRASDVPVATFAEGPSTLVFLSLPWSHMVARHPQLSRNTFWCFEGGEPGVALMRDVLLSTLRVGAELDVAQQAVALGAIVQLCGAALAHSSTLDVDEVRVSRALAAIDANLHDPALSPARLADMLGLSRRRLDELFAKALGTTLAARIAEARLLRAAQLLREPTAAQRNIVDIAIAVGFHDPGHFSRAFKARFQVLPKHWRSTAAAPPLRASSRRHVVDTGAATKASGLALLRSR